MVKPISKELLEGFDTSSLQEVTSGDDPKPVTQIKKILKTMPYRSDLTIGSVLDTYSQKLSPKISIDNFILVPFGENKQNNIGMNLEVSGFGKANNNSYRFGFGLGKMINMGEDSNLRLTQSLNIVQSDYILKNAPDYARNSNNYEKNGFEFRTQATMYFKNFLLSATANIPVTNNRYNEFNTAYTISSEKLPFSGEIAFGFDIKNHGDVRTTIKTFAKYIDGQSVDFTQSVTGKHDNVKIPSFVQFGIGLTTPIHR